MRKITEILKLLEVKHNFILKLIIATLFVVGIAYSVYLGNKLRYPDEVDYYNIACNLISKFKYTLDGQSPTASRPPIYPFILASLLFLGASIPILRIINFLALGLCCYLLYKLVKKHSSPNAGLLSVIIMIFYPVLFYTSGALYPQIIGSFLLLTVLILITGKEPDKSSLTNFFWGGLVYGLLILTVPAFLLNLPPLSLSPWFFRKKIKPWHRLYFYSQQSLLSVSGQPAIIMSLAALFPCLLVLASPSSMEILRKPDQTLIMMIFLNMKRK